MKKETNFTEGKIMQLLLFFAVPVLFALFLQAMYGAVDLLIIGKFAASADVSAVSTGSQIMMMLTNAVSAFAMGTTILLGQQIGSGKKEEGGKSVGTAIVMFAILAGIFSSDVAVVLAAADYLKAYAIDCMLTAIFFCCTGFYNGIGRTKFVMLQGIIGALGVRVPISYLMSRLPDTSLFKIGLATPMSSAVQLILCLGFMLYLKRKKVID